MSDPKENSPVENESESPVPVSIERDGKDGIAITWSDGRVSRRTARQLRQACPCATCREKKRGEQEKAEQAEKTLALPVLSAAEAKPLTIEAMRPVGTYAYSIAFSDGHSSGIYPFAMLRDEEP